MVKSYTPPKEELHSDEVIVKEWAERAEGIAHDAMPAVETRNKRWEAEWQAAEQREQAINDKFARNLQNDGMWLHDQLEKNDKKSNEVCQKIWC